MAYIQKPGGPLRQKTGHGIAPLMQKVAGTQANEDKYKSFFKQAGERVSTAANPIQTVPTSQAEFVGSYNKKQAEEQKLRADNPLSAMEYDKAVKNNDISVKSSPENVGKYGKGTAKASDTSAQAMILNANTDQFPGGKGFKGGTNYNDTTIFPNVAGQKGSGEIPRSLQGGQGGYGTEADFAGNKSKYMTAPTQPGALGKLESLASGKVGNFNNPTSESVTKEVFGAIDAKNQRMGGTRNANTLGRDTNTYGNSLLAFNSNDKATDYAKPRPNTFMDTGTTEDFNKQKTAINNSTRIDLAGGRGTLAKQDIFNNPQGVAAMNTNDTGGLLAISKSKGARGETATDILENNASLYTSDPKSKNAGGYETTYASKYEYPEMKSTSKLASGERVTTYQNKGGGGNFSPSVVAAENEMVSRTGDYNKSLKDYLTKGKFSR
jgi:hypothetical protein